MAETFLSLSLIVVVGYLIVGGLIVLGVAIGRSRHVSIQRSTLLLAATILPPVIGYLIDPSGRWIPIVCALPFIALGLFSIQTIRQIGMEKTLPRVIPENASPEIREMIENSPPIDAQGTLAQFVVIGALSFVVVCLFGIFFLFSLL